MAQRGRAGHPGHTIPPVKAPAGDGGYFEEMTRSVFQAGIDWEVIRQRWPAFRKAFRGFSAERVAHFGPDEIDHLLSAASGIVRNYRKVTATVHNAGELLAVQRQFGSFQAYLRSFDGQGYRALVKDMKRRFRHLGDTGAFVFLYTVGEEVPPWEERKG